MTTWADAAKAISDRIAGARSARVVGLDRIRPFIDALAIEGRTCTENDLLEPAEVARRRALRLFDEVGEGDILVVVFPPNHGPGDDDGLRTGRARLMVDMADGLHKALTRGARAVVTTEEALDGADPEAFTASPHEIRRRSEAVLARLCEARRVELRVEDRSLAVENACWEAETTDLARDRIVQLPGGEVFAHFPCTWSGELPVLTIGVEGWERLRLVLDAGRVDRVCSGDRPLSRLRGRRLCEVGIGTNPGVALRPDHWVEKARGALHVGLGARLGLDIGPPTVHSDVLVPEAVLVADGCVVTA